MRIVKLPISRPRGQGKVLYRAQRYTRKAPIKMSAATAIFRKREVSKSPPVTLNELVLIPLPQSYEVPHDRIVEFFSHPSRIRKHVITRNRIESSHETKVIQMLLLHEILIRMPLRGLIEGYNRRLQDPESLSTIHMPQLFWLSKYLRDFLETWEEKILQAALYEDWQTIKEMPYELQRIERIVQLNDSLYPWYLKLSSCGTKPPVLGQLQHFLQWQSSPESDRRFSWIMDQGDRLMGDSKRFFRAQKRQARKRK